MVYIVKVKGHTVDMVKSLRKAEDTFKECYTEAQIFAVAFDGSAKLIKQK